MALKHTCLYYLRQNQVKKLYNAEKHNCNFMKLNLTSHDWNGKS